MTNFARTISLEVKGDHRGSLIALENNKEIPFDVKRIYYVYGTKLGVARGFHAHKNLQQLAICVKGSCTMLLDNGKEKEHVFLQSPKIALEIDSNIWREMHDFSEDCVLLVLASDFYDESDYIRDYNQFLEHIKP